MKQTEFYEVSSVQKRLYILDQLNRSIPLYNIPSLFLLKRSISKREIEDAFNKLIMRHESLRTNFTTYKGEPVQVLHESKKVVIKQIKTTYNHLETEVIRLIQPFDLESGDLLKITKLETEDSHYLLIDVHHIVADGLSVSIMMKEFIKLVEGDSLLEEPYQYIDFTTWQNDQIADGGFKKDQDFWRKKNIEPLEQLGLIPDYERQNQIGFNGRKFTLSLDASFKRKVDWFCRKYEVTPYIFFMSSFKAFLHKYTGQENICIGTPTNGRDFHEFESVIGMFVNTLPVRNRVFSGTTFVELVKSVQNTMMEVQLHQSYPFELLIQDLSDKGQETRNGAIFDVVFNFQNQELLQLNSDWIERCHLNIDTKISKFNLTLDILEGTDGYAVTFEYNDRLFMHSTIEQYGSHYSILLNNIMEGPEKEIRYLSLLSNDEKKILNSFSHCREERDITYPLHKRFEETARKFPNKIAVEHNGQTLSYQELNRKANSLAWYLMDRGVKKGDVIGLCIDTSIEAIIVTIGVLKCGGVYLPLEKSFPDKRRESMLLDSDAKLIIADERQHYEIFPSNHTLLMDDILLECINEQCLDNPSVDVSSTDNAYIIYTSGTSGKPKGSLVMHQNVTRVVCEPNYVDILHSDNILQTANMTFDGAVFNIFAALLNGGTLHLIDREQLLNSRHLAQFIEDKEITLFFMTTALVNILTEYHIQVFKNVRKVLFGGENASTMFIDRLVEMYGEDKFIHVYGPTETAIFASAYPVTSPYGNRRIPIGQPITNTEIYILDKANSFQPIGVPGEICISGKAVSNGYINNKELTDKLFVENPFHQGRKMYRTGDIGRWRQDGSIEFLGRRDTQIKIRGYRIETAEIANQMAMIAEVKQATVITKGENESKQLVAFFTSDKVISVNVIHDHLVEVLPEYMIPSIILQIDSIPLNKNGKIDRTYLQDWELANRQELVRTNRLLTETEQKLARLFQEILMTMPIHSTAHFFLLGGNSLKASVLIGKIYQTFKVEIQLKEIFECPTVEKLSMVIKGKTSAMREEIREADIKEKYKLSSSQKRQWILEEIYKGDIPYNNMPHIYKVNKETDIRRLEKSFRTLIERHEALRTAIIISDTEPYQVVEEKVDFQLDKRFVSESTDELEGIMDSFVTPFCLSKPPLMKANLITFKEGERFLLFDMSHIISDGISIKTLMNDLEKVYRGKELDPLPYQFKDYSEWQIKQLSDETSYQASKEYWLEQFRVPPEPMTLPYDFTRPKKLTFGAGKVVTDVRWDINDKVNHLASSLNCTPYMVFLACFKILLHKYSQSSEITVGTPVSGRNHHSLEYTLGMFVNTLCIRTIVNPNDRFVEFLEKLKLHLIETHDHQNYPFDLMVDDLNLHRDIGRNPLFDVMFTEQNFHEESTGSLLEERQYHNKFTKFDIGFEVVTKNGKRAISVEYRKDLFNQATIEQMACHFTHILEEVCNDPEVRLKQVRVLDEKEKDVLIQKGIGRISKDEFISFHRRFEMQVEQNPDRIALISCNKEYSYMELHQKSNTLAGNLKNLGVKKNDVIGLSVKRNVNMIVGLLGIMKAGAAYLPIDPTYPNDRIAYMLENSHAKRIITEEELEAFPDILALNINKVIDTAPSIHFVSAKKDPDALAYMIYTSGSTGLPKGVKVLERSLHNLISGLGEELKIKEHQQVLSLTTISFDIFLVEVLVPLAFGLKVVLANEEEQKDPTLIMELLQREKIDFVQMTPSRVRLLMEEDYRFDLNGIKTFLVGGEPLDRKVLDYLKKHTSAIIYNMYGPTETTVWSMKKQFLPGVESSISIGVPITNTRVYVVDGTGNMVPNGVPGELVIAGEGVSAGYHGLPELTKEKFIPDLTDSNLSAYRTGDRVRWNNNDEIEFIGRVDNQIKLNGFRIELGEIKELAITIPAITNAIAKIVEVNGASSICLYYSLHSHMETTELKRNLGEFLPDYRVPLHFVEIQDWPLTPNGKIDEKKLPVPKRILMNHEGFEPPSNSVELMIQETFAEVLSLNKQLISVTVDFFEIGGDSLKAILLTKKLTGKFNVRIPVSLIFEKKSIRGIAGNLPSPNQEDYKNLVLLRDANENRKKNLFFIHPLGGAIHWYHELAKLLNEEYNIYAIQASGLTDDMPLPDSLESMCSDYVNEIKKVQPNGPYTIAAYCAGGVIGMELIHQLEKSDVVSRFILLDSVPFEIVEQGSEATEGVEGHDNVTEVKDEEKTSVQIDFQKRVEQNVVTILSQYTPKDMMRADITLIKAEINQFPTITKENWEQWTKGSVTLEQTPGDHFSLLEAPQVMTLAEKINHILQSRMALV